MLTLTKIQVFSHHLTFYANLDKDPDIPTLVIL
jgi:hypothetical protein